MPASSGGAQTAIHLGMAAEDQDQVTGGRCSSGSALPVAAAVLCSLGILVFFIGINYEDFTAYLPLSRMFLLSALTYGSFLSSAALLLYRHISSVLAGHGRPMISISWLSYQPLNKKMFKRNKSSG